MEQIRLREHRKADPRAALAETALDLATQLGSNRRPGTDMASPPPHGFAEELVRNGFAPLRAGAS